MKRWTAKFIFIDVLSLFLIWSCSSFGQSSAETVLISDLEGRLQPVIEQFNAGLLGHGGESFTLPTGLQIVFNGDMLDRGPYGMRLLQLFLKLKDQYPDRVHFVWGNRDVGKLRFLGSLHEYRMLTDAGYVQFLAKSLGATSVSDVAPEALAQANRPERQVEYWAKENGMEKAVGFHQQELAVFRGHPVDLDEARRDYFDLMTNPKRDFLRFIAAGQFTRSDGRILYVHGGIPAYSGIVPEQHQASSSGEQWSADLNAWGAKRFRDLLQQTHSAKSEGVKKFLEYVDAIWVPEIQTTLGHENSVIYGTKFKQNGSYVLPPEKHLSWYNKYYDLIVTVHNPVGDYPVLMQAKELGLFLLMGDTSYSDKFGALSNIRISQTGIKISGQILGHKLETTVDFATPTDIGLMNDQGQIIIAEKKDDPAHRKVSWRLEKRRAIYTDVDGAAESLRSPYVRENSELVEQRGYIDAVMKKYGATKTPLNEVQERYAGRTPILISGASSYNDDGSTELFMRETLEELIINLKGDKISFLTGGTDSGTTERIVHELAAEYKIPVHGLLVSTANPGSLSPSLSSYSLVGDRWADQIPAALELVEKGRGFAVFFGGGPHVRAGIGLARQKGLKAFLSSEIAGASRDLSAGDPRSFNDSDRLVKLLEVENPDLVDRNVVKLNPLEGFKGKVVKTTAQQTIQWFRQSKRKVYTLSGFSGQGYENEAQLKESIERQLRHLSPAEYIINIGGTEVGIGVAYEIAKKRGFYTTGIVSEKALKYGGFSPFCDLIFAIGSESWGGFEVPGKKLSPVSKLMVYVSDVYAAFGGGDVALQEFEGARILRKATQFFPFASNREMAIQQAAKKGLPAPTNFKGSLEKNINRSELKSLPAIWKGVRCERVFVGG